MKPLPQTEHSVVLRTDYSDSVAWREICAEIAEPNGEFRAYVTCVEEPDLVNATTDQLIARLKGNVRQSFLFVVDAETIANPEHPLLVVDLRREPGRTFRVSPRAVSEFLGQIRACHNAAHDAWILGPDDYARSEPGAFHWNECERISLEALSSDPEAALEVQRFWDRHLPFMMAVHSDYDYLALELASPSSPGRVVHGFAPAFEEVSVIAPDFDHFLRDLVAASASNAPKYPFDVMLSMM